MLDVCPIVWVMPTPLTDREDLAAIIAKHHHRNCLHPPEPATLDDFDLADAILAAGKFSGRAEGELAREVLTEVAEHLDAISHHHIPGDAVRDWMEANYHDDANPERPGRID